MAKLRKEHILTCHSLGKWKLSTPEVLVRQHISESPAELAQKFKYAKELFLKNLLYRMNFFEEALIISSELLSGFIRVWW